MCVCVCVGGGGGGSGVVVLNKDFNGDASPRSLNLYPYIPLLIDQKVLLSNGTPLIYP